MLKSKSIIYQNTTLIYQKYGNGSQKMICFHGFGLDKSAFGSVSSVMTDFTFYSFDIPFHGESTISDPLSALTRGTFHAIMNRFYEDENIDRFSLMGFSMGARLATSILFHDPGRVNKLYLLAPDGIKSNFWYSMGLSVPAMPTIFKYLIFHPKLLIFIANLFVSIGILNKRMAKFALSEVETEQKRKRLYFSWLTIQELKFKAVELARILNKHKIACVVVTGKQDEVIEAEKLQHFIGQLALYQHVVLDCGHPQVIAKYGSFISKFNFR